MRFERESTRLGTISVVDIECFLDMEKKKNVILVFYKGGTCFSYFSSSRFQIRFKLYICVRIIRKRLHSVLEIK